MARMSYEANKQKTRVPMPELDPVERAKTFDEVALGYSEEEAVLEARRGRHHLTRHAAAFSARTRRA